MLKVCGHVKVEDAIASRELGVDMIGVVGVRSSPRYVPPEDVSLFRSAVGDVFYVVDYESVDSMLEVGRLAGAIQVHRHLSRDEMRRLGESGLRIIAVVPATEEGVEYVDLVRAHGLIPLIHSTKGRLEPRDLEPFGDISDSGIAGGIGPENAGEFLAMRSRPLFIDVSRGAERPGAVGVKDARRIAEMLGILRTGLGGKFDREGTGP
ncbi:MAG: hypothetical protein ACP5G6_05295 [Conexivisphaera sp.]